VGLKRWSFGLLLFHTGGMSSPLSKRGVRGDYFVVVRLLFPSVQAGIHCVYKGNSGFRNAGMTEKDFSYVMHLNVKGNHLQQEGTMRFLGIVSIVAVLLVSGAVYSAPKSTEDFAIGVKTTAPWNVAFQKFTGPFSGVPKAMEQVNSWVQKYELVLLGPILSEYYNSPMEVDSTKLEWAIMFPVLEPVKGFPKETDGEVSIKKLDPVQVAYTYHQGPYQEVGGTYMKLFQWVFQNGYRVAGPMREFYWSDPHNTPEDKLISELQIPVTKQE
jgi:effector-binding domain-containing protein